MLIKMHSSSLLRKQQQNFKYESVENINLTLNIFISLQTVSYMAIINSSAGITKYHIYVF